MYDSTGIFPAQPRLSTSAQVNKSSALMSPLTGRQITKRAEECPILADSSNPGTTGVDRFRHSRFRVYAMKNRGKVLPEDNLIVDLWCEPGSG